MFIQDFVKRSGKPTCLVLTAFLLVFFGLSAQAAQEDGDARSAVPPPAANLAATASGPRTSPFDPPSTDTFVTDAGPGLDTGCTFNDDPNHPLVIDIVIDKFVGDVDGSGHLANPAPLVSAGIIPATVDVIMPAYDVDVNGSPPPESDQVFLNGESLGFLTGDNNIWKLNTFSVDIRKIKFPSRPAPGGTVTPVTNRIQINIDTLSSGRWCTAIDWTALVIPVRPKLALELKVIAGNKIRQNTGAATIDTIYQQDFDAACNVNDTIGPIDQYPFSGPATSGLFGGSSGEAKLRAKLKTCPENSIDPPEVKAEWTIGGGPSGSKNWTGFEDDITLKMPDKVGSYTVDFTYTINGTQNLNASRKLFVTKAAPLGSVNPPRLAWYEKGTRWASGLSDESAILTGVLSGLYGFGTANWHYVDGWTATRWEALIGNPMTSNQGNCVVFSDVFQYVSETLGIGGLFNGLSDTRVYGSNNLGFLTAAAPSLDPLFPGNARPFAGGAYDRYHFGMHDLRQRGWFSTDYYDATFNKKYASKTQFVAFNVKRGPLAYGFDADANGLYLPTDEGAKIYLLPGNAPASPGAAWGNWKYTLPAAPAPIAPTLAAAVTTGFQFPGGANYQPVDANGDGIYEALTVDVDLDIQTAGTYTVLGALQKGTTLIANRPSNNSQLFTQVSFTAEPGTRTVTLSFSGEQIFQSSEDGPYDLVVYAIGENGYTSTTLQTPAYSYLSFGELATAITGVSDEGVDENSDGKLEGIRANVDVNGRTAGNYRLLGSLIKDGTTLVNADTEVAITAGQQTIPLVFPGLPLKRSGQDGPYEGAVSLLDANGHTVAGLGFVTQPYSASAFASVIEPVGTQSDQGIDTNGNGLYDTLSVSFDAAFSSGGTFLLTGILGDAAGTKTVFSEQLITVTPGTRPITLDFAGPDIYGLQIDGPYRIEVSLRDPATQTVADRVTLPQQTQSYRYTDFDPTRTVASITLTNASSDQGVDTDGNGAFNQLRVDVAAQLQNSGTYTWSARLVDERGTEIGFYTTTAFLSAGNAQIGFVFDGTRIGQNGKDGPYYVKSLLMFGSGANLVVTDVATTAPYQANEFEGYVARVPGDLNGDSIVDATDLALFRQALGSVIGSPNYNPDADLDGDGRVTVNDLRLFRQLLSR